MPVVRTLLTRADAEIPKIKGSRFFGFAAPASTEASAMALLDEARATWPDATHHCWGWRSLDGTLRSSDDGEPSNTAGPPIARRLQGADLFGIMLVVMRYYGGTKLGTGGLVRAYGETAATVLLAVEVIEHEITTPMHVTHGYGDSGGVQSVLHAFDLTERDAVYGVDVSLWIDVPVEQVEQLTLDLRDRTAGRAAVSTL